MIWAAHFSKLHRGAESERCSVFCSKPNLILLCLRKRKQHINPKSCKHRVVNTPQHPPHPCWGGLACFPSLCESRWQPPNSDLVQSVASGEEKKKYLTASPYKCKTWEVQPTAQFCEMFGNSFANRASSARGEHMLLVLSLNSAVKNPLGSFWEGGAVYRLSSYSGFAPCTCTTHENIMIHRDTSSTSFFITARKILLKT